MSDRANLSANISSARIAGLRYVTGAEPGITRVKHGAGFAYRDARGRAVHDAATLHRIRSLVIPPAWTRVWICSRADGHVQATGRDARGPASALPRKMSGRGRAPCSPPRH